MSGKRCLEHVDFSQFEKLLLVFFNYVTTGIMLAHSESNLSKQPNGF